jgi:sensor histidine kinase YesM
LLLQPFVENVFVHAFDSNSRNPTLLLSLRQIDNFLICEIKDNGKGMPKESLKNGFTSKGIRLAKERIALFQSNATDAIRISSSLTEGTKVILKLQIIDT